MKRISVLFVVLALMLGLLAGCGTNGRYGDGSNVSTTDDGTVNGVNPDGEGLIDDDAVPDGRVVTGTASPRTYSPIPGPADPIKRHDRRHAVSHWSNTINICCIICRYRI